MKRIAILAFLMMMAAAGFSTPRPVEKIEFKTPLLITAKRPQ